MILQLKINKGLHIVISLRRKILYIMYCKIKNISKKILNTDVKVVKLERLKPYFQ